MLTQHILLVCPRRGLLHLPHSALLSLLVRLQLPPVDPLALLEQLSTTSLSTLTILTTNPWTLQTLTTTTSQSQTTSSLNLPSCRLICQCLLITLHRMINPMLVQVIRVLSHLASEQRLTRDALAQLQSQPLSPQLSVWPKSPILPHPDRRNRRRGTTCST